MTSEGACALPAWVTSFTCEDVAYRELRGHHLVMKLVTTALHRKCNSPPDVAPEFLIGQGEGKSQSGDRIELPDEIGGSSGFCGKPFLQYLRGEMKESNSSSGSCMFVEIV